jgi:alanyl-tRNA synthetase
LSDSILIHANHFATQAHATDVQAEDWSGAVVDVLGGKSGGKQPTRQGQGEKPEKIDEAVDAATKWLESKLKI